MTTSPNDPTGTAPPLDTPEYPRISDYVTHWASHTPDAEALVLNNSRISYAELATLVDRCATRFVDLGVQRGDRVAMLSTPRPEFLIVFLASARIGAVWLGLNPRYTLDELRYVIGDAQPVVLVVPAAGDGRDFRDEAQTLAREHAAIRHVVVLELGPRFTLEPLNSLLDVPGGSSLTERCQAVTAPDAALLVYTSGTTGRPKGAPCFPTAVSFTAAHGRSGSRAAGWSIPAIGRLREMFKSGGYNVYPKEIETVLESHPAVSLAAVVATPDPLYGEVGTAFLVCEAGASVDDALLRSHCRERLANYKIPKHFHVLDAMPMLPIGKVDRAELRRRARQVTR
jgi:acyl-CoA synthetase (AMP-forming)/AMP-acid ligase II